MMLCHYQIGVIKYFTGKEFNKLFFNLGYSESNKGI